MNEDDPRLHWDEVSRQEIELEMRAGSENSFLKEKNGYEGRLH